jgi:hypothetical protein
MLQNSPVQWNELACDFPNRNLRDEKTQDERGGIILALAHIDSPLVILFHFVI